MRRKEWPHPFEPIAIPMDSSIAHKLDSRVLYSHIGKDALQLRLAGTWRLQRGLPSTAEFEREMRASAPPPGRIVFDCTGLERWDSSLLTFLGKVDKLCAERHLVVDRAGLPAGLRRLLELAEAVPEKKGARPAVTRPGLLERFGAASIAFGNSIDETLAFLGDLTAAFGRLLRGKARFRTTDLSLTFQECGANAVAIVTLISFLVGTILAFMGDIQLRQFGASIYVADMVGIGIVRELGAVMTAIIMAGRTGAAFAAQLGTMKVTQEIDALSTTGLSPMEFLVLPRLIALTLMMPFLCLYADGVGILGGATIGATVLHLPLTAYYQETIRAITLTQLFGGLFKVTVYGALIAIAGCLRGFQCGQSSSAVGDAAKSAVVTGIVLIVIACGLFAWVFNTLNI